MAEYYLSNSGDDSASGKSPESAWKTLDRLQRLLSSSGLQPGDSVFFQKGCVFFGSLEILSQNSGTRQNPIQFSSYGNGDLPVLSAHKYLCGWRSLSSNLYEIQDDGFPSYVQMLQINGKNRPKVKGRELIIRYNGTENMLTTDNIPNFDFSGGEGEVVIEKNAFIIDKCLVRGRSGNYLTIDNPNKIIYPTRELKRFVVQNLAETLQEDGDWMYSPSRKTITMYSEVSPNERNIRVSFIPHVINGVGNLWNYFENLSIEGANDEAVRLETSHFCKLRSISICDTGLTGIGLWSSQSVEISNCTISNAYCTGIQQRNNSRNLLCEGNLIQDVYPFFGSGGSGDARGFGIFGGDGDTIIKYNKILRSGYVGIRFGGSNVVVENNVVDGFCLIKQDGGGIYSYGGMAGQNFFVNRVVRGNTIIGNVAASSVDAAVAFYTDDNEEHVLYENNLAINVPDAGFYNHNSKFIRHRANRSFGSRYGKLFIHNNPNEKIRENKFTEQEIILIGKDETPYRINTDLSDSDIKQYGTIDHNVFVLVSHSDFVVATRYLDGGKRVFSNLTLTQWRSLGYDTHSKIFFLKLPEYEIRQIGSNRFRGGKDFTDAKQFTNIFFQGGKAQRSIIVNPDAHGNKVLLGEALENSDVTTRIELSMLQLGELDEGKAYLCRIKASAPSGHQSLNVYFNKVGWPYTRLTREWHFVAGKEEKLYEFVVDKFAPVENCSCVIDFQSHQGKLIVSDFEFVEIIAGTPTDYRKVIDVIANPTGKSKDVELPVGDWTGLDSKPLPTSVPLNPFESKIIVKAGTAHLNN